MSPFGHRGTGDPKANDSLDAMRLDFLKDYNNIMQGSDEFSPEKLKELESYKQMLSQTDNKRGAGLKEMMAAGELHQLKTENEALKKQISVLKDQLINEGGGDLQTR